MCRWQDGWWLESEWMASTSVSRISEKEGKKREQIHCREEIWTDRGEKILRECVEMGEEERRES